MHQRIHLKITALALALATLAVPSLRAQATPAGTQRGPGYTAADVQFMQGMIAHHAQALVMAAMAPTHGASPQVSLFCRRVLVSQRDEIELMQEWLRERGEMVPAPGDAHAMHLSMSKDDHQMQMLMPGMLTAEQLEQLDQSRGSTFDRLFLTFMIQHHEGALTMVAKLFDSPGAGQTPEIFGYATGVDADQRAEIARMQDMLTTITGRTPK
jgi:uncharacterized protein (DUF305 family)